VRFDQVACDAEGAAAQALEIMDRRCERLPVNLDVDVIDFTDVPLSENSGRNEGRSYEQSVRALDRVLAHPQLAGLTITELNPDHAEQGARSIERFAEAVAKSLARALTTASGRRGRPA
jgi:arginase